VTLCSHTSKEEIITAASGQRHHQKDAESAPSNAQAATVCRTARSQRCINSSARSRGMVG
jgi:hypothetical protein